MMHLNVNPFEFTLLSLFNFLDTKINVFIKFGTFWATISSNSLSASFSLFWDSHYDWHTWYSGTLDSVSKVSEALFIFLHSFFLFLRLYNLN